ncbi:MAG: T9SS type A sorting domain-containing protein [Aequorivita sp.]
MKQTYFLLMLLVSPILIFAQAGTLDPTFGTNGVVTTAVHPNYNVAETTVVQTDGKILVAGNAGTPSTYQMAVARYNEDGSLDTSFGGEGTLRFPVGSVKSFVMDMAQQPDGKILLGGRTWDNVSGDFAVVRLNEDGSFDDNFGTNGIFRIETAETEASEAMALLDDGTILMVGYKDDNFTVAKINTDGSLDTTFGMNGWVVLTFDGASSYADDLAIQGDGKIVISGFALNGQNRFQVAAARLNADGSTDNSFGTDGKVIFNVGEWNDFGEGVAIQSDGKILIGGHKWISNIEQRHDLFVARLNTDGSIDTSYGNNGAATARLVDGANYAGDMVLQADDKPILAGYTILQSEINMAMVRFDTDGNLDSTFNGDGMVSFDYEGREDYCNAIALQPDNKIILAGYSYGGGGSEFEIARFLNDPLVGIQDQQNLAFHLYPNPAREQLIIEMTDASSTYQIEIIDMLGKKIYNTKIQKMGQIDVSALATGTYLVKLNSNSQATTVRFVKQ